MSFSVLDAWLKDECLPCLDSLLQLCEKLNIKPVNLLLPGELIRSVDADRMEKLTRDGRGHRTLSQSR